jgi:hypothetical protein
MIIVYIDFLIVQQDVTQLKKSLVKLITQQLVA